MPPAPTPAYNMRVFVKQDPPNGLAGWALQDVSPWLPDRAIVWQSENETRHHQSLALPSINANQFDWMDFSGMNPEAPATVQVRIPSARYAALCWNAPWESIVPALLSLMAVVGKKITDKLICTMEQTLSRFITNTAASLNSRSYNKWCRVKIVHILY